MAEIGEDEQLDIIAGVVTGDSTAGLEALLEKVSRGLETDFPQYRAKIVHAHTGQQPAGGGGNVLSISVPRYGLQRVTCPWHGIPAKANGLRAILEIARRSRAAVCLIVDPAQQGFASDWVDALIRPTLHSKYDMVTPIYRSSVHESLLSRNLLTPLLRALFGHAPKQPVCGEFVVSARLLRRLLARRDWDSAPARYTPALWAGCIAGAEGFRQAESHVGASRRRPSADTVSAHAAWSQVVESLFLLMDQYAAEWSSPASTMALDAFGMAAPAASDSYRDNGLSHLVRFVDAFPALRQQWRTVLHPHTFAEVEGFHAALQEGAANHLTDAAWVRIVYEMAAAWKLRLLPRSHVIGLLFPLFLARAGSFTMKTQWSEQAEIEADLAHLSEYFSALQPVLQRLWNGQGVAA